MQIRFADKRPEGDYALELPVAGKDRSALNSTISSGAAGAAAVVTL
jgi:leucyl aminopeptidase